MKQSIVVLFFINGLLFSQTNSSNVVQNNSSSINSTIPTTSLGDINTSENNNEQNPLDSNTTNITSSQETNTTLKADLVMVLKGARKLYLSKNGKVLKDFDIALGEEPKGHKIKQGDNKTPEGYYKLDKLKIDSDYYRSLRVSYPNAKDVSKAKALGVSPGGQIMIHGQPNDKNWFRRNDKRSWSDWTAGCIALENSEMDEVLELVDVGTHIVIKP